jgi:hypothetical protein
MNNLYVIGGRQRELRPIHAANRVWNGYQNGIILEVEPATQHAEVRMLYTSPPDVCADEDPEILFHAGTIQNDVLYTCSGTEVLTFSLPSFKMLDYISLPYFNDVHHVRPTPKGNLLAASAGLELVIEFTHEGEIINLWNVLGEDPWQRFSKDVDYRKIGSTKPHHSHPNFTFYLNDDIWATRFHQGDAICLTQPNLRIQVSNERIHDGLVHEGYIYFTVVSGKVVVVNAQTLQIEDIVHLNTMVPEGTLLGWCRGILIDDCGMWVGFSRIRPTKFRENVAWVARGFRSALGTRIAHYDLVRKRCIEEVDLEQAGLNAVFSVFPVGKTRH